MTYPIDDLQEFTELAQEYGWCVDELSNTTFLDSQGEIWEAWTRRDDGQMFISKLGPYPSRRIDD